MTLSAGTATSSASTTATIAAANGGTLAYPITLSCVGSLPRGASCTLSTPVLNSPAVTSTVTVAYNPQLAANHIPSTIGGAPTALYVSFAALFGGLVVGRRRRRHLRGLVLAIAGVAIVLAPLNGCSNSTPAGSALNLTASSAAVAPATPVTFSAAFAGSGPSAVPSGTVTFNDSFAGTNRTLGALPLTAQGMAVLNASSLPIGLHSVTAVYAGDSHYPGATSNAVPVQVSSSAALQIIAIDANGRQVSAALGVKLQ